MPFPWKKANGKRFSQLVSNHLQTPKCGASLLIETGFPASIADLFVKNSDRFNNLNNTNAITNINTNTKSNSNKNSDNFVIDKKKKRNKKKTIPPPGMISIPSPSPGTTRESSDFPTPSRPFSVPVIASPRPCGDLVVGDDGTFVHDRTNCEAVSGKHVFVAVAKMFFVVMMALGAKRFSVGIALAAFLLLFIEYAGRRFGGVLATLALARWASSCLVGLLTWQEKLFLVMRGVEAPVQEIRFESNFKAPVQEIRFESDFEAPVQEIRLESDFEAAVQEIGLGSELDSSKGSLGYPLSVKMKDLVSEIQVVQPSSNLVPPVREIPSVEYEFNLRNGKEKWAKKVEEKVIVKMKQEQCIYPSKLEELLFDGNTGRATRRSRIKSKFKKLANKLNGSKSKQKKKNTRESNCDEYGSGNVIATNQGDEVGEPKVESDNEFTSTSSSSSEKNFDDERVNSEDSICLDDSSINNKSNIEEGQRERSLSSRGYLVILVIVLSGLMAGRVLALVLALSWFLILKFGLGTRLRRITN